MITPIRATLVLVMNRQRLRMKARQSNKVDVCSAFGVFERAVQDEVFLMKHNIADIAGC